VHDRRRARQHVNSFLLCHGRHYSGKKKWGREHRRWLAEQQFDHPAQRITLEEYIKALEDAEAHMERITGEVQEQLAAWRLNPYVEALQALRGVSWLVAATVVAEVGDLTRFHPRELMAFLGMIPSEYSSGEKRRQGAITKSGNAHVRRVLCEAAWAYQHKPAITLHLLKRQEQLSKEVRDIAWKAQLRLCRRFALLSAGGKHRNKVNIAIGRELLGFIWDIARCVAGKPATSRATDDSAPHEVYVLRRRPKSATASAPKTTTGSRQRKSAPKTGKQKAA
jgi:transposase